MNKGIFLRLESRSSQIEKQANCTLKVQVITGELITKMKMASRIPNPIYEFGLELNINL
jgi:hypothetical protein